MVTKSPKFHGASANGFWYRSEKHREAIRSPPPVIGLNLNPLTGTGAMHIESLPFFFQFCQANEPINCETFITFQYIVILHLVCKAIACAYHKLTENDIRETSYSDDLDEKNKDLWKSRSLLQLLFSFYLSTHFIA